jgi:mannosyl-glycoprotein endo-beta-N-acetylglucosaminidase
MRRNLLVSGLLLVAASVGVGLAMAGSPAAAAGSGVTGTARQWVNVRSTPASTAASVGSLSGGQQVTVICQVTGSSVTGPGGASNLWDRLGEGRYVSHAYLTTPTTPVRCDAVPAPKPGLTAAQTAFLTTVAGPAMQAQTETRVPASVTIAQAILESGWGRGDIPRTAHNYFGAKCHNGNKGTIAVGCRDFPTRECNATGCYAATGSFRVYSSVLDSIRDHARILSTSTRYATAFSYSNDADRFAAEIHKAGYATDPKYTELLTGIMKKYDLYRYDVR